MSKELLLSKEPMFHDLFDSREDVFRQFGEPDHPRWQLLFAGYIYEDYAGDAIVVGYDHEEKKFFEVNGSHCSCYGLEDQWDVEYYDNYELLVKVLEKRNGYFGSYLQQVIAL